MFVGEDVTLAHIARPLFLADALDKNKYDIHFASGGKYDYFIKKYDFSFHKIYSIPSEKFFRRGRRLVPLYSKKEMLEYIEAEKKLLFEVSPDLVVTDFRYTLCFVAEAQNIPLVLVTDAHWSPHSTQKFPIPEHILTKLFGLRFIEVAYSHLEFLFIRMHEARFKKIRKSLDIPSLKSLRENYVSGRWVFYAGVPSLGLTKNLPVHHRYFGPALWQPPVNLSERLKNLSHDVPIIYVSMGSSGEIGVLGKIIKVLAELNVNGVVSTAGRFQPKKIPANIYMENYIPALEIIKKSALVICNGGSPAVYQAFFAGVPVLGIPSNIDQFFVMDAVEKSGAGLMLRPMHLNEKRLKLSIGRLLVEKEFEIAAKKIQAEMEEYDAAKIFSDFVENFSAESN